MIRHVNTALVSLSILIALAALVLSTATFLYQEGHPWLVDVLKSMGI